MLFTLLSFAVAIGLLVTIHELGHYWVARRCGVYIERFSVGFGRVLYKRVDKRGCEWALSALPLGGYVMMRQADFESKSLAQRSAITVAGPLANLLLAAVLYALVGAVGTQEPVAVLAQPVAHTAAAAAGVQAGDVVQAVDQKPVKSWMQMRWELLDRLHTGGEVVLQVQTAQGFPAERRLYLAKNALEGDQSDPLNEAGLALFLPNPSVQQVVEGGAAQRAGVQSGDVLLAVDGQIIQNAAHFVEIIQPLAHEAIQLTIDRHGHRQNLAVIIDAHTHENGQEVGRIGIVLGANAAMTTVRYGPIDSLWHGVERTTETFWLSLKMIGRMVTGEVSVKNISGPVSIADYAGQSARVGLSAYIHFLALVSVSIGLLNLLPIPLLDGGHLLYYAIEAVTGKPITEAAKLVGQRIGLGLLAALTVLAFFNDFTRLLN